jgi:hypothetical protein
VRPTSLVKICRTPASASMPARISARIVRLRRCPPPERCLWPARRDGPGSPCAPRRQQDLQPARENSGMKGSGPFPYSTPVLPNALQFGVGVNCEEAGLKMETPDKW